MSESLSARRDLAASAAWEAGKATLRWFQTELSVEWKADRTPVTAADRESERVLRSMIKSAFPEDSVLGEEGGEEPLGASGYRWIVDPIDGTKSFIQGVPLYGVLVGLEDPEGEAVVGAACFPALGELLVAARGLGCTWNGRAARASRVSRLAEACVAYTSRRTFRESGMGGVLDFVEGRARILRGWGDCYGHCLVATGRADVMLDPVLADWDTAALLPIVEEAGGRFTDWRGRRTIRGKSGISTNGQLGPELMRVLAEAEGRPGGGSNA